jgi:hypothetical protein
MKIEIERNSAESTISEMDSDSSPTLTEMSDNDDLQDFLECKQRNIELAESLRSEIDELEQNLCKFEQILRRTKVEIAINQAISKGQLSPFEEKSWVDKFKDSPAECCKALESLPEDSDPNRYGYYKLAAYFKAEKSAQREASLLSNIESIKDDLWQAEIDLEIAGCFISYASEKIDLENDIYTASRFCRSRNPRRCRNHGSKSTLWKKDRVPYPDESIALTQKAIERGLSHHDYMHKVAYNKQLGWISIPYGEAGIKKNDYEHGYGLFHVKSKHPEVLKMLPECLAKGHLVKDREGYRKDRRVLVYEGYRVILSRTKSYPAELITIYKDSRVNN